MLKFINQQPLVLFITELFQRRSRHHLSNHAAALAYYTLLSVVPMLFFILSVGSLFLNVAEVQAIALDSLQSLLPGAEDVVRVNIESIFQYRGAISPISGLWTLWSASGMFTALETAINAVWDRPNVRPFLKRRLIGILSLLGVTAWVPFALFTQTLWRLLPRWFPILMRFQLPSARWAERTLSFMAIFILNIIVYRFFPAREVEARFAFRIGCGVSAIWVVTREFFSWALTKGVLSYPLVYGSLWSLGVPIVWAYWSYQILLLGAELQAYLEERRVQRLVRPYQ